MVSDKIDNPVTNAIHKLKIAENRCHETLSNTKTVTIT